MFFATFALSESSGEHKAVKHDTPPRPLILALSSAKQWLGDRTKKASGSAQQGRTPQEAVGTRIRVRENYLLHRYHLVGLRGKIQASDSSHGINGPSLKRKHN